MWWHELDKQAARLNADGSAQRLEVDPTAEVHPSAVLDPSTGPIRIGRDSRICAGAFVQGPVEIGADCLIGNMAMIRGPATIGDGARIGFAAEVKNAIVEQGVSIGPQCFVADSKLCRSAYLGAQVRTSNHRLDGAMVSVMLDGQLVQTGREKLGCLIGERASVGIQVIVLPGRTIAPGSLIGPRVTVEKNLPPGRYRLAQQIETF